MNDLETNEKERLISVLFADLIGEIRELKSSDRTERDRRIAVSITEVEKAYAYFKQFVYSVLE